MRLAVVGFGKMGMLHTGIVNALEGHEIVAVAEPSDALSGGLKRLSPGIRVYSDYLKMLDDERPDGAFITTPVHMHTDMGMECAKRGIPFFLEKPMSLTAAQAAPLAKFLEEKPVVNFVGWMMRYIETFKKAKEILDAEVIGKVISFNVTMYVSQLFKRGKGWRYDKTKSGGGVIMGPCSHSLDLVHHYFGRALAVNAYQLNPYSAETEDFIHVMFEMPGGVRGWLDSSWSVRGHRMVETNFRIHGERGMLLVSDDAVRVLMDDKHGGYAEGWTNVKKPELWAPVEFDIGGPQYTREDVHFLECVRKKKFPENDVAAGVEVHRVIDAVYASAANGGNRIAVGA